MSRRDDAEALEVLKSLQGRRAAPIDSDEMQSLASEAVARGLQAPPPDGRFRPWIHRIFVNLVVDRFRRLRVEEAGKRLHAPAVALDPEQELARREEEEAFRRALAALPAAASEPLLLHFFHEHDYGEMVRRLACARPTVRTRIHRALRQLRKSLGNLRALFLPLGPALKVAPLAVFVVSRRQKVSNGNVVQPAPAAVTRFDFENDVVTAEIKAPDGVRVDGDVSARQPSLIEIPGSFVPALVKTLENL